MEPSIWIIQLLASALTGGLIGLERQLHGRPAGLRTHMLVSMAACMVTIAGVVLSTGSIGGHVGASMDAARVVAGVVTGIGFLGAGAIIKTDDLVRGLTTAACIWFVAVLGILCGLGMLYPAAGATLLGLVVLTILAIWEDSLASHVYREMLVVIEGTSTGVILSRCGEITQHSGLEIQDTEIDVSMTDNEARIHMHLRMRGEHKGIEVVESIANLNGVKSVAWQRTIEAL